MFSFIFLQVITIRRICKGRRCFAFESHSWGGGGGDLRGINLNITHFISCHICLAERCHKNSHCGCFGLKWYDRQPAGSPCQPRSQGLFPDSGLAPPPSQGKGPGNDVESLPAFHVTLQWFLIKILEFFSSYKTSTKSLLFGLRT